MKIVPVESKDIKQVFKQHYGSFIRVSNTTKKGHRTFLFENTADVDDTATSLLIWDVLAKDKDNKPKAGHRRITFDTITTLNIESENLQYINIK